MGPLTTFLYYHILLVCSIPAVIFSSPMALTCRPEVPWLTPANLEAQQAVLGTIMAPEEEAKLVLNPQLARQFLKHFMIPFDLRRGHLEVRGNGRGEGMTFRRFYSTPEALFNDMPTCNAGSVLLDKGSAEAGYPWWN